MNCPTCGSDLRVPLSRSRYRCVARSPLGPARLAPPSLGSAWTSPLDLVPDAGTCGTVYVDTEELALNRLTHLLLTDC